jgi:hypothetical protein
VHQVGEAKVSTPQQIFRTLFGLVYFLDLHGLRLRQRYREQRDGAFIYVERKDNV